MNENENLVTENVAENAENTAEQTPKTYTQEEVNAIVGKRLARQEARIKKDYDRKYGDLTETLKAGTGKETVEELNDAFTKFYEGKGIKIKKKPEYSEHDLEVLARAEANEIIGLGDDEVIFETDRLAGIGASNMTAREKAVFKMLAEHRQNAEKGKELSKIGVTEDVYNSAEFKDFASKFNSNTPITDIYDIYSKTKPKKEFKTAGSMKNTESADTGIKDFYTPEEARQFTKKDFDNNPELYQKVVESSYKWK